MHSPSWKPFAGCRRLGAFIVVLALVAGCGSASASKDSSHLGIPSFAQVDEGYYRGGQPTEEGIRNLKAMGVKTIVSLRHRGRGAERERDLAESLGMRWVNYPMWFWWRPSDEQVRDFIRVATTEENRPVFVHCRQGWNRAGMMTAIYRIAHDGWTPDEAYREGRKLGLVAWNPFSRHLLYKKVPEELSLMRGRASADEPLAGG